MLQTTFVKHKLSRIYLKLLSKKTNNQTNKQKKTKLQQSRLSEKSVNHSVVLTLCHPHELQPARLLCPLDSPGKTTGVGCHTLLQGIFPTHGSHPGLLHCRQIYCLSHWGSLNQKTQPKNQRMDLVTQMMGQKLVIFLEIPYILFFSMYTYNFGTCI